MFVAALLIISLLLTAQAVFTFYLMIYTWQDAERAASSYPPTEYVAPRFTFTLLVPARDEQEVIYETLQRLWAVNYPKALVEIQVICHAEDTVTIAEAQRAIADIGAPQVQVVTFDDGPINKPHALNVGLRHSSHDIVAIFDAEDDVAPDLLQVVNTILVQERAGVVQGGVQLMNFSDHWFSLNNCLEYFFWFKSRLHFHARIGMIPLGGNTVFIRRNLLHLVGGWDDRCLTEDADIGLRLSTMGVPIRVFYDQHLVTREETPPTIWQFMRQRTRWHQGYLQVLRKGTWRLLPRRRQRWLAVYSFAFPWFQGLSLLLAPLIVLLGIWVTIPVLVAMASFLPLYALGMQAIIAAIGARTFAQAYAQRLRSKDIVVMLLTFVPFQVVQGICALRALGREARRRTNWEKTAHIGAHR